MTLMGLDYRENCLMCNIAISRIYNFWSTKKEVNNARLTWGSLEGKVDSGNIALSPLVLLNLYTTLQHDIGL